MLSSVVRQWLVILLSILLASLAVPKLIFMNDSINQPILTHTSMVPPHLDPAVKQIKPIVSKMSMAIPQKSSLWAVQIGSFKSLINIQKTINQLKNKGFTVQTRAFDTKQGKLWRVWVGELISRQAAEDLNSKLHQDFGVNGFVMRLEQNQNV